MNVSPNPVELSFERAALRCADLSPLVYQRLFTEHPETRAMFRSQGSELVKGSMLALAIEAILDFAGERSGHFRLIACEVVSHDAYGTSRALLGAEWSPDIAQAWDTLLVDIDIYAAAQA